MNLFCIVKTYLETEIQTYWPETELKQYMDQWDCVLFRWEGHVLLGGSCVTTDMWWQLVVMCPYHFQLSPNNWTASARRSLCVWTWRSHVSEPVYCSQKTLPLVSSCCTNRCVNVCVCVCLCVCVCVCLWFECSLCMCVCEYSGARPNCRHLGDSIKVSWLSRCPFFWGLNFTKWVACT